ncbi:MAG: SAF domain-containing protein [Acidimicrobiales bacterium]
MADIGSLVAPDRAGHVNGQTPLPGPRPLRRRRGLPNTRAVAGGLLVAAAAVGLFAAYARLHSGPSHSYVVTRHAMVAGTRVQASDLAVQPMDLPPALAARAFERVADVAGTTLLSPLGAGELLQPSSLVATRGPGGLRTASFPVDRTRLGALKQGDRVDVLSTYGTGNDAWTGVVLRNALVVDVDRSKSSLGDTGSTVVTLAIDDPNDELALAHAESLGKVTVVVATGATAAAGPPATYRTAPPPPATATATAKAP